MPVYKFRDFRRLSRERGQGIRTVKWKRRTGIADRNITLAQKHASMGIDYEMRIESLIAQLLPPVPPTLYRLELSRTEFHSLLKP